MQNFKTAAAARRITVQQLADQIIAEPAHRPDGGRLARGEIDIDNAVDDDIDLIAGEAARAIRNGDDDE